MGCKYDLLTSAWLPEKCRDEELSERRYDNEGHIKHCGRLFVENPTIKVLGTEQNAALDNS
jgi:hypothetical protein